MAFGSLLGIGLGAFANMFGGRRPSFSASGNIGGGASSFSHQDPDYKSRILGLYDQAKEWGPRPTYNKSVIPELSPHMRNALDYTANTDFGVGNIYQTLNEQNRGGQFGANVLNAANQGIQGLQKFQHYKSPVQTDAIPDHMKPVDPLTKGNPIHDPFYGKRRTSFEDFNTWLDENINTPSEVENATSPDWIPPTNVPIEDLTNPLINPTVPKRPSGSGDEEAPGTGGIGGEGDPTDPLGTTGAPGKGNDPNNPDNDPNNRPDPEIPHYNGPDFHTDIEGIDISNTQQKKYAGHLILKRDAGTITGPEQLWLDAWLNQGGFKTPESDPNAPAPEEVIPPPPRNKDDETTEPGYPGQTPQNPVNPPTVIPGEPPINPPTETPPVTPQFPDGLVDKEDNWIGPNFHENIDSIDINNIQQQQFAKWVMSAVLAITMGGAPNNGIITQAHNDWFQAWQKAGGKFPNDAVNPVQSPPDHNTPVPIPGVPPGGHIQ